MILTMQVRAYFILSYRRQGAGVMVLIVYGGARSTRSWGIFEAAASAQTINLYCTRTGPVSSTSDPRYSRFWLSSPNLTRPAALSLLRRFGSSIVCNEMTAPISMPGTTRVTFRPHTKYYKARQGMMMVTPSSTLPSVLQMSMCPYTNF